MTWSTVLLALVAALLGGALVAGVASVVWGRRGPSAGPGIPAAPDLLAQHRAEVRHQLDRVADLVHGLSDRQLVQHGEVTASLTETLRATSGLAATTGHLRDALANPQRRGQWGERMADDVLRLAGFVEGINYRRQVTLPCGTVPDVTFLLPGDLVVHMDVKFPLDNYLRAVDATEPEARRAAEVAFGRDVRRRVKELAGRGYVEPGVTVDHVLLFIPNEAVYGFVHQHDPGLADLALGQKVVLCSPFTLFAMLGVIRQAVEAHEVARASDEILGCLAGFTEQWQRFADQLEVVARRFDTAHRGLEELTGPRRRQLDRQLDRVDALRTRSGLGADADADVTPGVGPTPPPPADGPRLAPVDRAG